MKIGIVNDSPIALECLRRIVEAEADMDVCWVAQDGIEALEKCRDQQADMILMDIVMPRMDGVEATREIMKQTPCSIILVTASVTDNVSAVFEAMGAGAVDVVPTPPFGAAEATRLLLTKMRSLATLSAIDEKKRSPMSNSIRSTAESCVLIGSSAGGPAALMEILTALPADLRAGVVIIQHVDERFSADLALWLAESSNLPVRLAKEGDEVCEGSVLIARGGQHLVFGFDHHLHCKNDPESSYKPSVDVMFDSAIKHGPRRIMGVLLTGMGRDGAAGLNRLRQAGHLTIAQDEKSSAIYGMPRAAAQMGAAVEILPPLQIAERIKSWTNMAN